MYNARPIQVLAADDLPTGQDVKFSQFEQRGGIGIFLGGSWVFGERWRKLV